MSCCLESNESSGKAGPTSFFDGRVVRRQGRRLPQGQATRRAVQGPPLRSDYLPFHQFLPCRQLLPFPRRNRFRSLNSYPFPCPSRFPNHFPTIDRYHLMRRPHSGTRHRGHLPILPILPIRPPHREAAHHHHPRPKPVRVEHYHRMQTNRPSRRLRLPHRFGRGV